MENFTKDQQEMIDVPGRIAVGRVLGEIEHQ